MSLRLVLSVAAFIAASSTTLAAEPPTPPWQSPEFQEHPLVGQIIDVDTGEQLPVDTVLKRAAKARFLILGERHDNPDHHSIQAWVMEQMVERGRRPALVYEMLEADEQDTINNWRADNPADAAELGAAVNWQDSGWPAWSHYQPMADIAVTHGLPLLAGNISLDTTRAIARKGLENLPGELVDRLSLMTPDAPEVTSAMRRDVDDGHCNLMPEDAIAPMVTVQRARDAQMAATMIRGLTSPETDQAILIAGNGHARTDRGVPLRLSQMGVSADDVFVIAPMEVVEDMTHPADYAQSWDGEAQKPPFDIMWFTPRIDSTDHCQQLQDHMASKNTR